MANTTPDRSTVPKAATKTEAPTGQLPTALLAQGRVILKAWTPEVQANLGVREKTANKKGTRAAMLAVSAFGYEQGKGRLLAQAVRAAMGLDPNVGGVDSPWLEKEINMATITPLARIRQQKDGVMRLVRISAAPKAKVAKPKVAADKDRTNGPVVVRHEPVAEVGAA